MSDALLVTSSFLPGRGGIETYLAELSERLSPRLAVFAPAKRAGEPIPSDLPYPTLGYGGSLLVPSRAVLRAIEQAARDTSSRRVLFGTPWPLALLGPALAERGVPYSVIVHGAEVAVPAGIPGIRRLLLRSLEKADVLFPVSQATRRQLEGLLGDSRGDLPPMPVLRTLVDVSRFRPGVGGEQARRRAGLGPDDRAILCFGRLIRRKGVHRVIKALPEVSERVRAPVTLVVAGTGSQEARLRRLARRTGARVRFLGRVNSEEAPAIYDLADVFVLAVADRWGGREVEGLGVVLLEAAASAVPCVTGRSGGTPEAVIDGTTGFVVNARRRDQLVHAISSLLMDDELRARMGAAGRRHVEQTFAGTLPSPLLDWLES